MPLSFQSSDDGAEATPLLLETTPIATTSDGAERQGISKPRSEITPLPIRQIFVLCWMRFSEPFSFNLIFPFINEMLVSVGIESPGYSSGLIEGVFSFAQLCTVFYWGSLSDRIGRKPVLLMGLAGTVIFTCLFGFSTSLLMILASRMLIGAFNGNVAVLKSAIAELTDETNQGRAFSFLPLSWFMGAVIAPIIGGFLARPAERFPNVFGSFSLFIKFPYLLACLVGAGITFLGWLVGFLFLEESLVRNEAQPSSITLSASPNPSYGAISSSNPETSTLSQSNSDAPAHHLSAKEILMDVFIRRVLVAYGFLALVTSSIDAVLVLWLFTPLKKGGIGFNNAQIGLTLSSIGVLATFVNLVILPPLQRRVGTIPIYRACFFIQVILVVLFPVIRLIALAERKAQESQDVQPTALTRVIVFNPGLATKVSVGVMAVFKGIGGMAFVCNMMLVSRASPSRTNLGAVNGLAQMVASSMRACGPTGATIFFALSNDSQYHLLEGNFVWIYMLALAIGGVLANFRVREGRGTIE